MSRTLKPQQISGLQQMPKQFLDKISFKHSTNILSMQKIQKEQDQLSNNRRSIRTIMHELCKEKKEKCEEAIKASRVGINQRVMKVQDELYPT